MHHDEQNGKQTGDKRKYITKFGPVDFQNFSKLAVSIDLKYGS